MSTATAKEQLALASLALFAQAADKHFEGVELARHAAKLELMVEMLSEEEILGVLESLIEKGVLVIPDEIEITGMGGDA